MICADLAHGLAHFRPTDMLLLSPAVVPASTFLVSDAAAATCLTERTTVPLPAVLLVAVHAALLIARMPIVIVLGAHPIFRPMMPSLNVAV